MRNIGYCLILTSFLFGCKHFKPELALSPPQLDRYLQWREDELKTFIDSTLTDSADLSKMMKVKCIDKNGIINDIEFIKGIKLYNSTLQSDTNKTYPIFELKNKPYSILVIKGNGQWGDIWSKILVDRNSNMIIKIEFDHKSETPAMGANFTDSIFESKFIHKKISFDSDLFILKNMDNDSRIAKYQIDGISGATITCDSAIQMINSGIIRYKNYLR